MEDVEGDESLSRPLLAAGSEGGSKQGAPGEWRVEWRGRWSLIFCLTHYESGCMLSLDGLTRVL